MSAELSQETHSALSRMLKLQWSRASMSAEEFASHFPARFKGSNGKWILLRSLRIYTTIAPADKACY